MTKMMQELEKTGVIRREEGGKKIVLVDMAEKAKTGTYKDYIYVPQELWTMGWLKKLSGRGLYFYFINLLEFKESAYKPVWSKSYPQLIWKYAMPPTATLSIPYGAKRSWR
jgi:hypothetical protein